MCWKIQGSKPSRRYFPYRSRTALGPTQPPIQSVRVSFLGVKWSGLDVGHIPPSSAQVKENVELYFYSPSGLSKPILGWTLTFLLAEDMFCHNPHKIKVSALGGTNATQISILVVLLEGSTSHPVRFDSSSKTHTHTHKHQTNSVSITLFHCYLKWCQRKAKWPGKKSTLKISK